ncbi:MAG: FixH family protein [Rhodospirillales bacterium]|nr:FixH family protein [Rhodospirillales bacterium]
MSRDLVNAAVPRRRAAGWWYPWIFVGGMLFVIAVNMVLVAAAIGTFPGLETADHYRKGLAYNTNLAAARAQSERGWQAAIVFDADASAALSGRHAGALSVRFVDRNGAPLDGLAVSALMTRPAKAGYDLEVPLASVGGGLYRAEVSLPLPGHWQARILAAASGDRFQTTQRIFVP